MAESPIGKVWQWGFVTYGLRNVEQSRFQRCRPRSHQCGIGLCQYAVGLSKKQGCRLPVDKPVIECRVDSRCAGNNELIPVETRCSLQHGGQISRNFLFSAAGKQCDNGFAFQLICLDKFFECFVPIRSFVYAVYCRIAHIVYCNGVF